MDDLQNVDPVKLLLRLNSNGSLKPDELEAVASVLSDDVDLGFGRRVSFDDVYSLILVLGRAKAFEYRNLIEKYLNCDDAFTVALALEILCVEWKQTEDYFERLINFALGVAWDEEGDVRQAALKVMGEYLYGRFSRNRPPAELLKTHEIRMAELLLTVFADGDADQFTRQTAYFSICRAAGKEWDKIPSECARLNFEEDSADLDWAMLDQFKRSVSGASSSSSSESSANGLPPATQ